MVVVVVVVGLGAIDRFRLVGELASQVPCLVQRLLFRMSLFDHMMQLSGLVRRDLAIGMSEMLGGGRIVLVLQVERVWS